MLPRVEIVHEDPMLRLGVCRNFLIIAWLGNPESAQLRAIGRARAAMTTKHKADVGTMNVVLGGILPRFTEEVRAEVVQLLKDARLQGLGTADVVLAPGLAGVTTRAFLSTSALVARSTTPHRVFGELRPAASWLAPLLAAGSVPWSVEEILAAQAEVTKVSAPAPAAKPSAKASNDGAASAAKPRAPTAAPVTGSATKRRPSP
jgi:hypothetical protein